MGLGGYHLGTVKTIGEATRIVHEAIDAGVTFLDNAWEYHDGESERRMGRAIADRRHAVFLMTKVCTHGRDANVAMRQLDESLRRLRTDYLDLWQIHECVYDNDPQGMKSLGGNGRAIKKKAARVEAALRYAMSLPVCTTVSGIDSLRVLRQNLRIARGFSPMNARERATYERSLVDRALDGRFELYKTSAEHEGTVGRRQHGFPSQDEVPL